MNVFCVISSVANDYGAYSYIDRLQQLLLTIESIRKYSPNDEIWLYDTSNIDIPDMALLNNLVERVVLLKDHYEIKEQNTRPNSDENLTGKKSVGEVVAYNMFLFDLKHSNKTFDRVFKLSGRWYLNEYFNRQYHLECKNSLVLKGPEYWHNEPTYRIRLWSFDFALLNQMVGLFDMIYNYTFTKIYKENIIPTLERTLYIYVNAFNLNVKDCVVLGVEGYFGQNASFFYE